MASINNVKSRGIFLVSLGLNLAMAITLAVLRRPSVTAAQESLAKTVTRLVTNTVAASASTNLLATEFAFHWRMIESADLLQYVANLRRVGCPEKILRDLVVAEVERQFKPKLELNEVSYQPWQGCDRREADARTREQQQSEVNEEKRALIRELLGYDWSTELSKVWDKEPTLIVFFGFLSDTKAQQLMGIVESRIEKAERIVRQTGGILLDEDINQLRTIRNTLWAEMGGLLTPAELDELQARAQFGLVVTEKLRLDGMDINSQELRELMRASRSYKDILLVEGPFAENLSKSEEATKLAEFEKVVAAKLGLVRLAQFKRAEDDEFCAAFRFTRSQKLPKETAVKIYETQRNAQQQGLEIRADNSLSADEKSAALNFLQDTTAASVTSLLGNAATNYLNDHGRWLKAIAASSENKPKPSRGGQR